MRHAVPRFEQSLFRRERQVKKDKLLRRLSAMQFAMWEMREFLDTHPTARTPRRSITPIKRNMILWPKSTRRALVPWF